MKSSEISTAESTQVLEDIKLPEELKNEVKITVNTIKQLLNNDIFFYKQLINQCLLVGKKDSGFFISDIRKMLIKHYPDLLDYEGGHILIKETNNLCKMLCLDSRHFQNKILYIENYDAFREEVDQIILSISDNDEHVPDLLGNLNMDL